MTTFENKSLLFFSIPLSWIYGFIIRMRNIFYDKGVFKVHKIEGLEIISIGNISVGGTGKTPITKLFARQLAEVGKKVVILSRGYGRKSKGTVVVSDGETILVPVDQAGDEPFLLARGLKNVPVVVEANRYKGALFIQKKFNPDIILLDDGYQHRRLHRNYNICLIDANVGVGKGRLLPAGFLREPIQSLNRADMVCLTRTDQQSGLTSLISKIQKVTSCPILKSSHSPRELINGNSGNKKNLSFIKGKTVLLFSGIARPESFEFLILKLGGKIIHHEKFSDHYQFMLFDLKNIVSKSEKLFADMIITTEKDFVRTLAITNDIPNFYYLPIDIKITEGSSILKNILSDAKVKQ
ncbi:tetraacyldisaccharide 4'-kinase [candidate division KSB1 bacterium 4572_119]|nr:MAG: tetraacyldisaccharide 4'-kinase [candidate division KSB1 bacterium 4572_119]